MIAGLVLAGGAGLRLGGVDKALLPLGAGCVLDVLLGRLAGQVGAVALSANGDAERFGRFGLPVLADGAGRGPLAGVLRGLEWAAGLGFGAVLTVPGDTPFVPLDLAVRLVPGPSCAANAAGLHPLTALWPVGVRGALLDYVRGATKVSVFGALIGVRPVLFGDEPDPFFNINTHEDFTRAQARVA